MNARTRITLSVILLVVTIALFWWGTPRRPQPAAPAPAAAPSARPPHDVAPSRAATPSPPATPQPSLAPSITAPALPGSPPAPPLPSAPPAAPVAAPLPPAAANGDEPAPAPAEPPTAPEGDASADLERVDLALTEYRTALGENPVGNNAEITRAIMGDNLKQVKIGVPGGSRLNAEGEMTDRWGTPYFFHQLSGTKMEIRSAGPDRRMWTRDDTVIGKGKPEPAVEAVPE